MSCSSYSSVYSTQSSWVRARNMMMLLLYYWCNWVSAWTCYCTTVWVRRREREPTSLPYSSTVGSEEHLLAVHQEYSSNINMWTRADLQFTVYSHIECVRGTDATVYSSVYSCIMQYTVASSCSRTHWVRGTWWCYCTLHDATVYWTVYSSIMTCSSHALT